MSLFTNYRIEGDCLLTWFPVRASASLREPRTRVSTFSFRADDPPFAIGGVNILHGQGSALEDGLASLNRVNAQTDIKVDADQVFFMVINVQIGSAVRTHRLTFQADTITPFLINVRAAQGEDHELGDTAVAFQGVVTAGPRRSQLVYIVARVLSFITRIPLKRLAERKLLR